MPATSSVGATSGAAPTELWRLASPIGYQDAALNRASANMRIPIKLKAANQDVGASPRCAFSIALLRKRLAHGRSIPGLARRSALRAALRHPHHHRPLTYPIIHSPSSPLGLPPKRAASLLLLAQLQTLTISSTADTASASLEKPENQTLQRGQESQGTDAGHEKVGATLDLYELRHIRDLFANWCSLLSESRFCPFTHDLRIADDRIGIVV